MSPTRRNPTLADFHSANGVIVVKDATARPDDDGREHFTVYRLVERDGRWIVTSEAHFANLRLYRAEEHALSHPFREMTR